jgi:hypothetical protein
MSGLKKGLSASQKPGYSILIRTKSKGKFLLKI